MHDRCAYSNSVASFGLVLAADGLFVALQQLVAAGSSFARGRTLTAALFTTKTLARIGSPVALPGIADYRRPELLVFADVSLAMMVDVAKIAQEATTASAFEAALFAALRQETGFDAACFLVKGMEQSATILGLDARTGARLIESGATYDEELLPVKRAALAARRVAVDTDVCGVHHVRQTRYHREIAATIGGQHSLMAYVPWSGRTTAAMMLGRTGKTFAQREILLIESLLPSIGVARAAFGLPWVSEPLPVPPDARPSRWLGFGQDAHVVASVHTASGTLIVRDRAGFREMLARNGKSELVWTRASVKDPSKSGWPYVELLHLAPALAKHRRSALFVGSGGAVSLRQFASVYPGIVIDVVEREPVVIALARTWFDLGSIPRVTVHIADGASFIRHATPNSWDIVVIDAYDASDCSAEFSKRDFLLTLRQALQPGGAVAWNVIGTLGNRGPVSKLVSSARSVFDEIRVVPVVNPDESCVSNELRNVIVVAVRAD